MGTRTDVLWGVWSDHEQSRFYYIVIWCRVHTIYGESFCSRVHRSALYNMTLDLSYSLEIKKQLVPATTPLIGFSGEIIWPIGQIQLLVTIGDEEHSASTLMNFLVVRSPSPYNGSTFKDPEDARRVKTVASDDGCRASRGGCSLRMAKVQRSPGMVGVHRCNTTGFEVSPACRMCLGVGRGRGTFPAINPIVEEKIKVAINPEYPEQTVMIGSTLTEEGRNKLCGLLQRNLDIFAWKPADMTGVPRHIAEHCLNVREGCSPVRQKKRGQAADRNHAIQEEVGKLMEAGIMREVHYHDWLSNPVMVKKHDDSWRMCVNFKDLNKACAKDGYPLPEIDWKVECLCGFPFKCFLDTYKGYHQIKMAKKDEEKTAFITSQGIFCYTKMPFGLRNVGATYQRLVDKAFHKQIGRNLELCVDDLVIKSCTKDEIVRDIEETFKTLREINMKLNLKKCTFGVEEGMFLGYKVNAKGLKVCLDKVDAVLSLPSPKCLKDVQKLNGKIASLNRFLARNHYQLPMLTTPMEKEELIVYLAATKEAVSAVLMTEREAKQMPIYFVSRALRGPKLNYTSMGKLVLALVHASKRLKRPRVPVKGQILVDFIVKRPEEDSLDTPMEEEGELPEPWILFTDGSSCTDGSGAGLILTNPEGMEFTYALRFRFDATNNEAKYEALIAGLRITEQMGVKNLQANMDSRLVANQVNGTYVAKEVDMIRYLEKVKTLTGSFKAFSIKQIPRSENKKADALSKIASTSFAHLSKQVLVEELKEKFISEVEILAVVEEEGDTWMNPLFKYLARGTLPAEVKKARAIRRKSWRFAVINGTLYKKSFLGPWLRCVGPLQANYVLREIHEGSCSMHAGTRSVVAKALRTGYYWTTMHRDARTLIRACQDCQVHKPVPRNPQQKFGLPEEIILDNGKQFRDDPFKDCLGEGIKARLEARSKNWMEELPHVLWAHRTMIKSSNGDTPFSLTYRTEAVIPAEIGMPTLRTMEVDLVQNNEALEINLDLLEERREEAAIREAKSKAKME
ncbi:reverse transcriptase domain-containing protein [Tanacetum coccineum]